MTIDMFHLLHQVFFGGLAAAGFAVLFNCPHRMLWICFGAGALALLVRTIATDCGWTLGSATFAAALVLAIVDRLWQQPHTLRGCVFAVVGCIPMVPGALAAKVMISFFSLIHAKTAPEATLLAPQALENFLSVFYAMCAMGIGLAIPSLVFPLSADD